MRVVYLDGMCPIALTVDALYTNAALPRISGHLSFITHDAAKY